MASKAVQTVQQGMNEQTPAARHRIASGLGGRSGARRARSKRRKAVRKVAKRIKRGARRVLKRLKKGSAAAKRHMAKIRRKRRG